MYMTIFYLLLMTEGNGGNCFVLLTLHGFECLLACLHCVFATFLFSMPASLLCSLSLSFFQLLSVSLM